MSRTRTHNHDTSLSAAISAQYLLMCGESPLRMAVRRSTPPDKSASLSLLCRGVFA